MTPLLAMLGLGVGFVLAASGCGDKKNPGMPSGGGADVTISILGVSGANSFSPSPDTVFVGQTVSWRNSDSITHTATPDASGFTATGNIAAGAVSAPQTVNTPGTFPYHCSIHTTMTGTLVVLP
jgi:plastocyanin